MESDIFSYSPEIFEKVYKEIYSQIFQEHYPANHQAIILGGQPGAGKSFQSLLYRDSFYHIDGDSYRASHPFFREIQKLGPDSLPEHTQAFRNQVVERLINDLSSEGVNLIVEGTLRNPAVPLRTRNLLMDRGYSVSLQVVVRSAVDSWLSTLDRYLFAKQNNAPARLVPLDKYQYTIRHLAFNIKYLEDLRAFPDIKVFSSGKQLYPGIEYSSASETVSAVLNLKEWNRFLPTIQEMKPEEYISNLDLLKSERGKLR